MKIILTGSEGDMKTLQGYISEILSDLFLLDDVEILEDQTDEFKKSLSIEKFPALSIEEPSIDFRDVIFQGELPTKEELHSLFVSIFGTEEIWEGGCEGCSQSGWCGWCDSNTDSCNI